MSTHHPEPSTGWEASWDATPAQDDRASRLSRLRDDDATSVLDPVRDHEPSAPAATTEPAEPAERPQQDVPDEPLVPDEVETTVPVGTPEEPVDHAHGTPVMAAEPEVAPPVGQDAADETPSAATALDPGPSGADAWRDLQVQFVDDPSGAVDGAVRLVQEAIEAHAGAHGSADTEELRQAFTRLRDLHGRLTG